MQRKAKQIALIVAAIALAGCVSGCAISLEKSVATCAALDGSWEYTKAGDMEKFSCQRPATVSTRTVAR